MGNKLQLDMELNLRLMARDPSYKLALRIGSPTGGFRSQSRTGGTEGSGTRESETPAAGYGL
nr:hypothetical protein Q903MT_gene2242 [Picea sitchensis]